MQKYLITLILGFFFIGVQAQYPANLEKKDLVAMFYNVENLFDTIDNPLKSDEEYTPGSNKKWNSEKYYTKIDRIAEVVESVPGKLPVLIGLAEVENEQVLLDLIARKRLRKGKYRIVHFESPDVRGIDVALLYHKRFMKILNKRKIANIFPGNEAYPSRDILYVKGLTKKKDTLHIMVNHWNSRRGGQEKSEGKRVYAANIVRNVVDSIQNIDTNAKVLIMGDFNDEPSNKSLQEILLAKKEVMNSMHLLNLMYPIKELGLGTYAYRGKWNMLDNIIVSKSLQNDQQGIHLKENKGFVYNPEFVCYKNREGKFFPSRTFSGKKYYAGYSDHFPVFCVFNLR